MSMKHLGETFDIHCGGIDHIQVHHTNEIAQSEGATGKKFVNYWLHGEFLILKNEKMAKSGDNFITLNTLIKNGYGPLEYRYLCLTAHYKSPLEFNYENLDSAKNGLNRLKSKILEFKDKKGRLNNHKIYEKKFLEFINDDLNTPKALALLWGLIDDKNLTNQDKYILALKFDKIFGLDLGKENKEKIPKEIIKLAEEREKARKEKNWQKSDKLREEIKNMGYLVEDIDFGYILKKN
jgi:cysteinyl-tRNA synthetase